MQRYKKTSGREVKGLELTFCETDGFTFVSAVVKCRLKTTQDSAVIK